MKIRLPLGRSVFLLCAFLIALVVFLPMRLALGWLGLDQKGISARAVSGIIWSGRLAEVRVGDAPVGDLKAGLSPVQLLVARARVNIASAGSAPGRIQGAIGVTRNSFGLDDMTGAIPVAAAFAPLPLETLDLSDVSLRFVDGQCTQANGQVRAMLAGEIAGLNLAQGLSGNARCDGGALLLPLQSQSGMEKLALRMFEDGRYTLDFMARPADPAMGAKLAGAGFRETPQGYQFSLKGRF
ncbi:type II secretion system protein N [Sphingobium boeckii]|uniref:Type II secretion system protein N n=1 Tax=Sphingobium boeckii TaxID=1082345 RepID=A0A7W9AKN7_9SPHN|nr:type II secretion system protein N [Sphingobium boeckii]MBB5687427.1 general secretion pathway protein N [Sphingobium boeckii]